MHRSIASRSVARRAVRRLPLSVLAAAVLGAALPGGALLPAPAAAQSLGFDVRLGAGIVHADATGFTGLVAPQLTISRFVVRAEARTVLAGSDVLMQDASARGSARVIEGGIAAGLVGPWSPAGLRVYGLGTLAWGVDVREADDLTAVGAVLGADLARPSLFAELRYEGWIQNGVRYYDLPSGALSLLLGLRIH